MTEFDLDRLTKLHVSASPGPWHVGHFDDEHFMSAVSVEAPIGSDLGHPISEVIAATLIQYPDYVVPGDNRWDENATLIAEMRNNLPELLRLARRGMLEELKDSAV